MLNLPDLIGTVQKNCHISDAQHAQDYGLCTYLLKMREFYRWEHELPFSNRLSKDELGAWLTSRERLWNEVESEAFEPLPLASGPRDPFDNETINRELVPQGFVYSGGYGRHQKPHFFLGELLRREERHGFTVLISSCEYARDLVAPPAMLQGRIIFARTESLRRLVWEKYEEWQWKKPDNAMRRAIDCYDFEADSDTALARMAANETDTLVLHELGEGLAGRLLGEQWHGMLSALAGSKAELIARAVRDNLADCLSTLPALVERENRASLHFFFANFDGLRRALFPEALAAYGKWLETGEIKAFLPVAARGREQWERTAQGFLAGFERDGADYRRHIEEFLPAD